MMHGDGDIWMVVSLAIYIASRIFWPASNNPNSMPNKIDASV